jgi:hypothetical protein
MFMGIAVVLFVAYFLNVFLGAVTGNQILGDIPEMLMLAVSTLFFVVAILKREAESKSKVSQ